MKRILMALCVAALGTALTVETAEAARIGGGRSMGAQRTAPMQRQAQPAAPAQQEAARPAPAAPAQQPAPAGSRWFGPLAGLAAGLGLGWLLGQSGMGGMMGGLLMMLLVGAAVFLLVRVFLRPRAEPAQSMQYAGLGNETVVAPPPSQLPSADAESQPALRVVQPQIPAGFDAEGFLKQAKLNFVQVQQANDRGDLDALREIATEEMFESLKADVVARSGAIQQTEVVALSASLLELATEGNMHWASVRFSGSIREAPNAAPEAFEEVWNLQKPVSGQTGWLLAGIQQVS